MSAEAERLQSQIQQLESAPKQIIEIEGSLARLENPRQRSQIAAAQANQRKAVEEKWQKAESTKRQVDSQLASFLQQMTSFAGLDEAVESVTKTLRSCSEGYQQVLSHRRLAQSIDEHTATVGTLQTLLDGLQQEVNQFEAEYNAIAAQFDPLQLKQLQESEQQLRSQTASLQTRLTMLNDAQSRAERRSPPSSTAGTGGSATTEAPADCRTGTGAGNDAQFAAPGGTPHHPCADRADQQWGGADLGDLMQDFSRHLQWNEDYSITLEVDGRQRQFAQLSGGEQMSGIGGAPCTVARNEQHRCGIL